VSDRDDRLREGVTLATAKTHHWMMRPATFGAALLLALTLCLTADGATDALIKGTPRIDRLHGTPEDDRIFGFAGDDRIRGLGGYDVLLGGVGDDYLEGGPGKDYLSGGDGDDALFIAYGKRAMEDFASCGAGDDTVVAEGVPESGRNRVAGQLTGAPSFCETVRFSGG
jgi:Ca2+-binding RTX toxin-like protein